MVKSGIVDIDIYKSTMHKEDKYQNEIVKIFNAYHELLDKIVKEFNGEIWHQMGDGTICIFPTLSKAVDACIQLLESMYTFNKNNEAHLSDMPLFLRVGIHEIKSSDVVNVPASQRGTFSHPALDIIGKLQKNCPIGKIAISTEAYKNLALKQRLFRPSLTVFDAKKVFVLTDRVIMVQEEKLLAGLDEKQKMAMPPIPFLNWNKIIPDREINLTMVDKFLEKPLLLILGETSSESKGSISFAATSDAVGIIEVMATLKSHREVRVGIDQWEDTADIVPDRNIIIIGGGMVNMYAFALNDMFYPVHFLKTGGRILDQIVATSNKEKVYYGHHAFLPKDSGLIIISKSPFNLEKVLFWIAGITGRGTQAVANFLKDLIIDSKGTLNKIGVPNSTHPIACVVGVEVEEDLRLSDYYKRCRISDYKVLWMADRNGDRIL